jgi:DNA-binding MarR family transcriptional regulator
MDNSQRRLLVDLISATNRLTRVAAQASGNSTPASQWRILSVLETDGPQRVGELASAVRISQPAITQFIPTLEDQRLVTRTHDPRDARATVLEITAEGKGALADWRAELGGALAPLLGDLTAEDWAAIERTAKILGAAA